MRLKPDERETIIIWNDGETEATITTANQSLQSKLAKLWGPGERLDGKPYIQWTIPKSRIRIPRPLKKRASRRPKTSNTIVSEGGK